MTILHVNGSLHQIADGNRTLLEVLRGDLGLKGAKLGCGEGECGACTVLLDGKPTCSCLILATTTEGRHIHTIEQVADTAIGREVIDALTAAGAVQCGFCTPGIVVAATGQLLSGLPRGLDAALEGNLCRCTGYAKIRQALESVAPTHETGHCGREWRNIPLIHALERLACEPDLIPIAGGTDLLVRHEHDIANRRFLEISRIEDPDLRSIRLTAGNVVIGGLATWSDILNNALVVEYLPLLAEVATNVASEQIRNMGTLAGNLVTASPAGDGIVALNSLDARLEISHRSRSRTVAVGDFVVGPGRTMLEPGELITGISIPTFSDRNYRQFFRKVGPRRAQAISKVSLGLVIRSERKVIDDLRICFGAVGPKPMTCPETTNFLVGKRIDDHNLRLAGQMLMREISPINDYRSSEQYRREVAKRLLAGLLQELA